MKAISDMNIGILTFHRANNIGAILQASALQHYIERNIGMCEIIDFIPNNEIPYVNKTRRFMHALKQIVTFPKSKEEIKKEKSYSGYRYKYLKLSKKKYLGDNSMIDARGKYDHLISGSDQILNLSLSGESKSYYLNFDHTANRISYASSFGRDKISDEEAYLVKTELPGYKALSVRELSGVKIIQEQTGRTAELVLDPVFLLSKDEWIIRTNRTSVLDLSTQYIFVYSMENSKTLEELVARLHNDTGLNVIVVRGGGEKGRILGHEDLSCGPSEFLNYISGAEYVVTNSFHGSAFSLIFGKKLYCIPHSKRNTRLESLLTLIDKEDKFVNNSIDYKNYEIDCEKEIGKLTPYIDASKIYLNSNLLTN